MRFNRLGAGIYQSECKTFLIKRESNVNRSQGIWKLYGNVALYGEFNRIGNHKSLADARRNAEERYARGERLK